MRVLITGGTGFFGKAMTRRLQQDGHDVCILSRDEAKQAAMAARTPVSSATSSEMWYLVMTSSIGLTGRAA